MKAHWIVLIIVALGVAAFFLVHDPRPESEGLVVHVYAKDSNGVPVTRAQVQRRFAPGWMPMGDDGYVRLTRVALRLGETPSNDAVAAAVEVKARFHANRSATPPAVRQREDGSYEAVFTMQAHGLLRLTLAPTQLPGARAALEPDPVLQRWEAVDGMAVARSGQPVLYRIYPELDRCRVHVMGDEGTASIRGSFECPSPGFIIERTVHALPSRPIVGKVLPPKGVAPPTLSGRVEVEQVSPDGSLIPMEPVVLHASGSFEIPYAGPGEYRLRAFPGFTGPTETKTVRGGTDFDFENAEARPWLVVEHPDFDSTTREGRFVVLRHVEGGVERVSIQDGVIAEATRTLIALNGPGQHDVHLTLPGTDTLTPLKTTVGVMVNAAGPHTLTMKLEQAPAGRLHVSASADVVNAMRGASVVLPGGRTLSWLKGDTQGVTFDHVPVGGITVTVLWQDGRHAIEFLRADILDEAATRVEVKRVIGGTLQVVPGNDTRRPDGPLLVAFEAEHNPYGTTGNVICTWDPGTGRWRADWRLRPGAYRATLRSPTSDASFGDVSFEIQANETTDVTLE